MKVIQLDIVYENAKVLIVDDQSSNVELLERILSRAGYSQIRAAQHPEQVISIFHEFQPDIILLDLHMPNMDGRELLQRLQPLVPKHVFLPIVILTADNTNKAKREALLLGANDFLTKPLDHVEVLLRIRNLLQSRFLSLSVQQYNQMLEDRVRQRTQELENLQMAIIECLTTASENPDNNTGEYVKRVAALFENLALGFSKEEAKIAGLAASLRDIGKRSSSKV